MEPATAWPGRGPVGPGCADYAEAVPDGAGSVDGHGAGPGGDRRLQQPAAEDPGRRRLRQLNPDVNLVDTLNGGEFTVFAPVDDAFAKIDAGDDRDASRRTPTLLTTILTYHVVPGQLDPDAVVGRRPPSRAATSRSPAAGDALKVNDANVICGGVQTANATVYLIDAVLSPKADLIPGRRRAAPPDGPAQSVEGTWLATMAPSGGGALVLCRQVASSRSGAGGGTRTRTPEGTGS